MREYPMLDFDQALPFQFLTGLHDLAKVNSRMSARLSPWAFRADMEFKSLDKAGGRFSA
jgi:hypothetical protein